MKKRFVKNLALVMGMTIMATSLAACGNNAVPPDDAAAGKETAKENGNGDEADTDPFGKFTDPVTITVAQRNFADAIPTGEDSPWIQKYKEYGINIEVEWSADASQFNSKLNTAIASGDVPDLFQVGDAEQMTKLVRADMVADLTDAFEKYASPLVKERFSTEAGKAALEAATFDGQLKYIPINVTESLNNMDLCYIRQDWVENLGMELPKTMEDLKELAIAFTKNDPDGNGENDTYGLAIQGKDGLSGFTSFFTGFGVYPGSWHDGMLFYSKDADGKVVWDGEKPEMKEGFQWLQDLYKEGAIAKDFSTYDSTMAFEDLNGGKAGICIGARGYPAWAIHNTYPNNKDAKWYAMKMPAKEGTDTLLVGFQPLNSAYAVSKECKNPEAVIKMLNLVTEISDSDSEMFDPYFFDENRTVCGDAYMVPIEDPQEERSATQAICSAIEKKDGSALSEDYKKIYDNTLKFQQDGSADCWSDWNRYYPAEGHAYYVIYEMNKDTQITNNLWQALPSSTMLPKLAVWKKTFDEAFVNIVSGADLSTWDQTLTTWAQLGGDDIKKEIEVSLGK